MHVMKKHFLDERRGRVSGGGRSQWGREESVGERGVSGGERSKFGEGTRSGDELKTMESSLKRSKGRYTRREEGTFAVGSISNKRNTDVNEYTDCQSAYDIYIFNYFFL